MAGRKRSRILFTYKTSTKTDRSLFWWRLLCKEALLAAPLFRYGQRLFSPFQIAARQVVDLEAFAFHAFCRRVTSFSASAIDEVRARFVKPLKSLFKGGRIQPVEIAGPLQMACGILFRTSDVKDNRVFLALAFAEKHLWLNRAYTILRAETGTEQRAERTERDIS